MGAPEYQNAVPAWLRDTRVANRIEAGCCAVNARQRFPTASGEMAEWLKAHAWKACLGETLTWVRIPLSPPALSTPWLVFHNSDASGIRPDAIQTPARKFPLQRLGSHSDQETVHVDWPVNGRGWLAGPGTQASKTNDEGET